MNSVSTTTTDAPASAGQTPIDFAGKTLHFIGIGGCGMSGLARVLSRFRAHCSGSDTTPSDFTDTLARENIAVRFDQATGELPDPCDLVIASAAIKPDHPEVHAAESRGIPIMTYAEALGQVQTQRTGVSIAGTHGKSTTAAMLCHVLIETGLDPSFIVGANCAQIGGGSRTGGASIPFGPLKKTPGLFIAEACEFNRSFHHHRPTIALINNVEEDHLDIYGSLANVVEAFAQFAQLVPPADQGGRLLIGHDGAHRREITAGLNCAVETFGFNPTANWCVQLEPTARTVSVTHDGQPCARWTLEMAGDHNALNAAAAAILAHQFGAHWDDIATAMSEFKGIDRRMQRLGERQVNGGIVTVYDDYGHHPTEIDATLRALRQSENPTRLICVFQPHQHSRTRFLLEQFANSFSSADIVIVPHIYFVRDSEIEKHRVSAHDLVDRLRQLDVTALHLYPFEAIVEQLDVICRPDDLLVIMGAGPVWKVGKAYLQAVSCAGSPAVELL